ncbi:hypothetical protein A3B61_04745 [Candidatus Peribacteria bacterium RIFCSPLOWO2_01_FULL_53_10]|nr:MAG: hypothetical protein A3B61_04745 [Candidatus Peribacteria bacterium RIFCSPLOWO2_01_FULL_53_10]
MRQSDAQRIQEFYNRLDIAKRKADNGIEAFFREQSGEKLPDVRKANDYAFKVFRDMWFIQDEWLERNGRFFQGKATMKSPPELGSGSKVEFDFGLTDQVENWKDIGYLDQEAPVSVKSDVYEGPNGKGYTITVQFKLNEQNWTMKMHEGPEDRGTSFIWEHPKPTIQSTFAPAGASADE